MNNEEAAKALLEGKTLRIISDNYDNLKNHKFKFNFNELRLLDDDGIYWKMNEFFTSTQWEEVIIPYKKEIIVTCDENGHIKECERFYPDQDERVNKKYKIIIEEII